MYDSGISALSITRAPRITITVCHIFALTIQYRSNDIWFPHKGTQHRYRAVLRCNITLDERAKNALTSLTNHTPRTLGHDPLQARSEALRDWHWPRTEQVGSKGELQKKKKIDLIFMCPLFPAYHARPQPNKINYGEPWDAFPSLTIIPVGTAFHPMLEHGIYNKVPSWIIYILQQRRLWFSPPFYIRDGLY